MVVPAKSQIPPLTPCSTMQYTSQIRNPSTGISYWSDRSKKGCRQTMENRLVPVQSRPIHFNMNLHPVGSKDLASEKYTSVQSHHKVKTYVRCGHTGALPLRQTKLQNIPSGRTWFANEKVELSVALLVLVPRGRRAGLVTQLNHQLDASTITAFGVSTFCHEANGRVWFKNTGSSVYEFNSELKTAPWM